MKDETFNLNSYKDERFDANLLITEDDDLKILIDDDDPIVFTGKSVFGNRIVFSIIEDLPEEVILRYFAVIVDELYYKDLINNKISLRELYEDSNRIYIVDFSYKNEIKNIYNLTFTDLPDNWLPLKDSYLNLKNENIKKRS